MAMAHAAFIGLPECFDYILLYIYETLPAPIYSFLINILANSLALFTALRALAISLVSTNPLSWDAQTVLPPLIGVFAAYLALLSLYRTTSWILRTSVWVLKWGTILGALIAGAGWVMGDRVDGSIGNYGFVSSVGGFVLDVINGQGQNVVGRLRSKSRIRNSYPSRSTNKKPKIWESFERHREWENQQNAASTDETSNLPQILNDFVGVANRAVGSSGWWSVGGGDADAGRDNMKDVKGNEGRSRRKPKSRSSSSRSR
jgi:hypothetical protein